MAVFAQGEGGDGHLPLLVELCEGLQELRLSSSAAVLSAWLSVGECKDAVEHGLCRLVHSQQIHRYPQPGLQVRLCSHTHYFNRQVKDGRGQGLTSLELSVAKEVQDVGFGGVVHRERLKLPSGDVVVEQQNIHYI